MTHQNIKTLILILVIVALGLMGAKLLFWRNLPAPSQNNGNVNSTSTAENPAVLEYKNDQYGFTFALPKSWAGYSVITQNWEGRPVDDQTGAPVYGPEIIIRHPLWTASAPRQDIPIMIFTFAQWDLVGQEKLSLGAAPIGPSELGRNAKYVFALPARYNFAFPAGFEEVDQIIQSKPLRAF